jgi:magnesium transporter
MNPKRYLSLLNPFELLRTKKVLHVNPTVEPIRKEPDQIKIFVYDYDDTEVNVQEVHRLEDAYCYFSTPRVSWINVDGLRKSEVHKISSHFGIHPLITEDILSIGQRPKMDEINGVIFCLLHMLYYNEKDTTIETEQISIVLGKNFVITFQEDASKDVFNPLRERLKLATSKIRHSPADFLFYTLIDMIVDNYFLVMEKFSDSIEVIEEEVIRGANSRSLMKINLLRKEMIVLIRTIAPVRELVSGILKTENELIDDKTQKYFKDVYDHIVQANDLAENYRDVMMNLQDLYLSNVNLKMNEVMKVMAIVTCLLAPATVVGGIFGMNFERIPFADRELGFYIALGLMIFPPIMMIIIFKRRGWF